MNVVRDEILPHCKYLLFILNCLQVENQIAWAKILIYAPKNNLIYFACKSELESKVVNSRLTKCVYNLPIKEKKKKNTNVRNLIKEFKKTKNILQFKKN